MIQACKPFFLLLTIFVLSNAACKAKSLLKGDVNERQIAQQKQADEEKKASPSDTSTVNSSPETLSIPAAITGALLTCFTDQRSDLKAKFVCGLYDTQSHAKVNLETAYVSHSFTYNQNTPLSLTVEDLPANSKYHALITATAGTKEKLDAHVASLTFGFKGVDIQERKIAATPVSSIAIPEKSLNYIRNARLRTDGTQRCIDLYSYNILTTTVQSYLCNTRSAVQDWTLTANMKISHALGSCLAFDAKGNGVPGDCSDGATPTWIVTGRELRVANTTNCLAESTVSASSELSPLILIPCNTADPTQQFEFGKY